MSEQLINKSSKSSVKSGRSRLEQAAILLLSVGEEAAAKLMQKMNRDEVILLSDTMARLHGVKVDHARYAMNNFFDDYREQSGINGASRSYLRSILEKALGGEIASSVINGIYGDEIRHRMARLQWVDVPQLAALIEQEHLQLQAVFLAFLPPDVAASVLSALSQERQDEIVWRIARLDDVNRDVIDELDRLIERGVAVLSEHGSKVVGIKHAANIVNRIPSNQQQLLDQLRERDAGVVDELEEEMYEFFILSRQTPATLQRLMEEIAIEEWAVALKGTEPVLRQTIFNVMPKRQVTLLQSTTTRLGPVPVSRVDHVRKEIMATVRQLAEEGEIQVQLFAEQTME
ncbi:MULTISPECIES: flagellar motor switch protein FliG [Lelliottia]|jgi:flagellar motor switch protein FliG|uniref:Flagellar motor switch protein FliG n=1 Tax=Lelliottia wanjuensis TaxID=3050585 RepID=A0AAP4D9R3_9ENTR|nr:MULTISPECIES: flagellar motor switch protein FliG [unclassified Lelliottia]MDI3362361.1 flagellar motor switch protein FliG [Lelliottia sp. V89_13]MDK9357985.1 flagellar motor switch protein FliG [Lelliottia sp. V106_16]MDK9364978.1 flagellar motor switch protein FliG [Lelliottia sp. V106_12]MDK9374975.1 flagellar motor switch protein FliG [Lelliottia sp. V106_10]MDK9551382.1 flagellar motor switch protein FliG [Lelliottia sp. V89_5]